MERKGLATEFAVIRESRRPADDSVRAETRCRAEAARGVELDTLLSVRSERLHAFYKGEPLNFSTRVLLPMTQDLEPVQLSVWTVSVWN